MRSAVFMSIKEIHINRILGKIKNHEFRTKKPKKDFDYIIVYVPIPVKELKYILKVKQPIASPNKIIIEGYGNKEFNNTKKENGKTIYGPYGKHVGAEQEYNAERRATGQQT